MTEKKSTWRPGARRCGTHKMTRWYSVAWKPGLRRVCKHCSMVELQYPDGRTEKTYF